MSDLISFKLLLMLAICWLAELIINSAFNFTIRIITYFLDGPLVVMLILGFFCLSLLFLALIIFLTLLAVKVENTSLICRISSIFGKILAFEAYAYNFLALESFSTFLLMELTLKSERGITTCDICDNGAIFNNRVGTEAGAGVWFEENTSVLFFLFELLFVLLVNFFVIHLFRVSLFSLSKMSRSYFDI